METNVHLSRSGPTATITFSAGGKPPTLDHRVLDDLDAHLGTIEGDASIRALVVRSDAAKYFVVGANIRALETLSEQTAEAWVRHGHAVFDRLAALPVPTIARVEGFALGGGLELAMACDLIAATTTARLGLPEAGLGFVPGWGGTHRLPARVGAARAKELVFTGRTLDAAEALAIGLVQTTGDAAAVDAWIAGTIERIIGGAPGAVAAAKRLLADGASLATAAEAAATVGRMRDPETSRRVRAFLESRRKG